MNEATSELLADANDIVREQLALAWREHIERVRDVMEAQWPERMERVLEETVAGLAARLEGEHQEALEARVQQANRSAETARRELIRKLNQITRRLRGFENERQWSNTLVDATRGFCGRAALFLIRDRKLHLETTRNFDDADLAAEVSLDDAPAFAAAIETRDTLVAMRSSSELSGHIAAYLGEDSSSDDAKVHLFPVVAGPDVPAILYDDFGDVDVDALELLVATADAALEPRRGAQVATVAAVTPGSASAEGLVNIAIPSHKPEILSWFSLSRG